MIGLIVPSNAPVFVGGDEEHGVAASPFVYGQLTSYYHEVLGANIVHTSSCQRDGHWEFGSCDQCLNARFYRLNDEHGHVHFLANCVRIGTPGPSPKNFQKSNKVGSPCLGTTFLLALLPLHLH